MIVGPRNAQTADRYPVAVAFRAVVGDRWAEFRPPEKEGEGSLGEKAVIPSGPPGRRSPFYQGSQSRFRLA
jgi:hypothetical protein